MTNVCSIQFSNVDIHTDFVQMPTERHYWMFGVTISCICIPFFLLIGSLNTTSGYHWWGSKFRSLFRWARFRLKTAEPVEETVPKKNAPNLDRSWSAEAGMEFRMGQRAEREREKERRHTVIDIPLRPGEKALTLPLPLAETKASDHSTEDSSSKPPDEADKEEGPKGEKREVNW